MATHAYLHFSSGKVEHRHPEKSITEITLAKITTHSQFNILKKMPHFVTHLESAIDGTQFPSDSVQTLHAGRPLWVRYDLDAVKTNMTKSDVFSRKPTMWRYRELLPIGTDPIEVSLGEGMSPLPFLPRIGQATGPCPVIHQGRIAVANR